MTTYLSKNDLEYTVDFGTNDDVLEVSALFDYASEGLVKYYHDDLYTENTDFVSSNGIVEFSKYMSTDANSIENYPYTVYFDNIDGLQDPIEENTLDLSKEVDAESGTTYYWRIKTSDGSSSSFTLVYSFIVN